MASNNLRIIYNNWVDLSNTTVTASSTATSSTAVANLKLDFKSLVWRSSTASATKKANLIVSLASLATIPTGSGVGIILPFTNLTSTATITVKGWKGSAPTFGGTVDSPTITNGGTAVAAMTTAAILCNPYANLGYSNWVASPPFNTSDFASSRVYSRVWIPAVVSNTDVQYFSIEIVDSNATAFKYVQASRLVIGTYWTPKYNTAYGLGITTKDLSKNERSEAGDLITISGPNYNVLNFDLKWLDKSDRAELNNIIRTNGSRKPLFISLFPDNSEDWEKEQIYQIYGKMSQINGITHPMLDIYSSQMEIEEI